MALLRVGRVGLGRLCFYNAKSGWVAPPWKTPCAWPPQGAVASLKFERHPNCLQITGRENS